jgi:hypothetical protein
MGTLIEKTKKLKKVIDLITKDREEIKDEDEDEKES